jgi:subtilisin family serine protease
MQVAHTQARRRLAGLLLTVVVLVSTVAVALPAGAVPAAPSGGDGVPAAASQPAAAGGSASGPVGPAGQAGGAGSAGSIPADVPAPLRPAGGPRGVRATAIGDRDGNGNGNANGSASSGAGWVPAAPDSRAAVNGTDPTVGSNGTAGPSADRVERAVVPGSVSRTNVTLVTGQTVTVVRRGEATTYLVDADVPMRRVSVGNSTYVFPEWVDFRTFEPALFDVERLLASGYGLDRDGSRSPGTVGTAGTAGGPDGSSGVPVIVEYADADATAAVDGGDGSTVGVGTTGAGDGAAVRPNETGTDVASGSGAAGEGAPGAVALADARALESIGARAGVLATADGAEAAARARRLAASGAVERVYLDRRVRVALDESATAVRAERARTRYGVNGSGVTVAVIDTGIDRTHPDLDEGSVVGRRDFTDENRTGDPVGHGTHVAGVITGDGEANESFVGVAPGASLLDARVLNSQGSGRTSWVIDGLEWAVDRDADVASMSLGSQARTDDEGPLVEAVEEATAEGTLVVAAAGNAGGFASVGTPGVAPEALTVAAVDDDSAVAPFSSRGPASTGAILKPEIAAPGVGVTSACPGGTGCDLTQPGGSYTALNGTSMATPHVSGVAALTLAAHPDRSVRELKHTLVSSARPVPSDVDSALGVYARGAGVVDADRAIGADLVVGPASLDFGELQTDQSVRREVTVTNVGDEPIRASVEATLENVLADESADTWISVDTPEVFLVPGETETVSVFVGGNAPRGLYGGEVRFRPIDGDGTAGTAGQSAAAAIGLGKPYRVTVRKEPLAGTDVEGDTVFAMPYRAFDPTAFYLTSFPGTALRVDDGTVTFDTYGGRYLLWSVGESERTDAQVITHRELNVSGDRTVTLDERDTVTYDVDVESLRAAHGPLANVTVQPTFQRYIDKPQCGESIGASRCEIEVELASSLAAGRDSRAVRFSPSPDADASLEHMLVPADTWNESDAATRRLDAANVYHLIHATTGIDGPETFPVDPTALAEVDRSLYRTSPDGAYVTEALVLQSVWEFDNTDIGSRWSLGGRTNQSYFLTPETTEYLFATRYVGTDTRWTTNWNAFPEPGDRFERTINRNPLVPTVTRWDLAGRGAGFSVRPLTDQPSPRIDFTALGQPEVTVTRDGEPIGAGTTVDLEADQSGAEGVFNLTTTATQSAQPLSTRVTASYVGRAGQDESPPQVSRVDLPTDGTSRLDPGPVTARVTVVEDVSDVFDDPEAPDERATALDFETVRVLYAPANATAGPFDDEAGLVARGEWREANETAVESTDAGLAVSTRLDAGVAAGGKLHLAVLAVDDSGNGMRVLVENASAVAPPAEPAAPTVVPGNASAPVTDPDGDGRYEDVNGDGRFTIIDVAVLLNVFNDAAVRSNVRLFDFSGDGRITIIDVATLLKDL